MTQTETEAAITNSSHGILLTMLVAMERNISEKGFGGGGGCCHFYSKRSPCLLYTDKGLINKLPLMGGKYILCILLFHFVFETESFQEAL